MTKVLQINGFGWIGAPESPAAETWTRALEAGDVLLMPDLRFVVEGAETRLFTPAILGSSKNSSYDPASGRLGGTTAAAADAEMLAAFIRRFSRSATSLVQRLLPAYGDRLVGGRASFRPAEIAGRQTTWRKDDTRLHVDAFPATPSGGRRILRVFSNVNPDGRPRAWRLGDDFDAVARRFAPQLRLPL